MPTKNVQPRAVRKSANGSAGGGGAGSTVGGAGGTGGWPARPPLGGTTAD